MHVYFGFTAQSSVAATVAVVDVVLIAVDITKNVGQQKAIIDSTIRIDMLCLCAFLFQCVFNRFFPFFFSCSLCSLLSSLIASFHFSFLLPPRVYRIKAQKLLHFTQR